MTIETEEMRQARHDLEMLSASDPAAIANMLRHVAAYSLMVTGRRDRERRGDEPLIDAGFLLTHGSEKLVAAATRRSGTDHLYMQFDVDDAAGPVVATSLFRKQGDNMVMYGNCRLWSPANDGRALIVPTGNGEYIGHFAFQPGRELKLVEAPLPGDFAAGVRRAQLRMQRHLSSPALRNLNKDGYVHCIQNEGEDIFVESTRAAA